MATTPQENAALVQRFLIDVVAGGDTDAVETFVTENVVDHNLVFGAGQQREAVMTLGWRVLAGADVDVDIHEVVAANDRVAVRATVTGTHRESLMDLAPTGASFAIAYAWFCRIVDDQIAEIWSLPDGLGLMGQLGAIPALPPNRSLTARNEHSKQ